uniref:Protein-tyrosine phosphatase n=1 Tax=Steinernema glaseri TaxID=37863 RepID=A0A1I8A198_9BILA
MADETSIDVLLTVLHRCTHLSYGQVIGVRLITATQGNQILRRFCITKQSFTKTDRFAEQFSPEAKEAVKKFVEQTNKGGIHALRLNYMELKAFVPPENAKTGSEMNPTKCRYKDVICFDKSRVVLNWPPGVKGDFIHANRVEHKLLDNPFICCQGPMDGTVPDFWRMVWQEKVKVIIMLCRCEELGKAKCAQYWPPNKDESRTFYGLTIKNEKIDTSDPSFVETRLLLTFEGVQRHVDHLQWTEWPDKSVPKTPMAPFRLLRHSRQYKKNPSIVHCSAGIGRTGTLIMIELVYKSLYQGKIPEVLQLARELRCMRSQAVQTEDQYIYIHFALLQLFNIKQIVQQKDIKSFCREYEAYLKLLNDNGGRQLAIAATATPFVPVGQTVEEDVTGEKQSDRDKKRQSDRDKKKSDRDKKKHSDRDKNKKSDRDKKKDKTTDEGSLRRRKMLRVCRPGGSSNRNKKEEKKDVSVMPEPKTCSPAASPVTAAVAGQSVIASALNPPKTATTPTILPTTVQATTVQTFTTILNPESNGTEDACPPTGESPVASVPSPGKPGDLDQTQMCPPLQPTPPPSPAAAPGNTPAKAYTIQTTNGKKVIVYQRSAKPLNKVFATPQAQQQPQIPATNSNAVQPAPGANPNN